MIAQKSNLVALASMLAMAPLYANAHMYMVQPIPYGHPISSPLDASGSNFPCQAPSYDVVTMNTWPAGSTQTLVWGTPASAVHGGGSCQISLTTDKAPTKNSVWKVIQSFEGGCPDNTAGNLPDGTRAPNLSISVPKDLPNGQYSMAWTWFNKIGNREMYMNCAPVTITGGSGSTSSFSALPDMAVANIGMGTCTTKEGNDYIFTNAGSNVAKGGAGPYGPLCANGDAPVSGGSGSTPAASSAAAAPAPAQTSAAAPAPAKGPPAAASSPAAAASSAPAAAPAPEPSSAPSTGSSPSSSSGSTCSTEGAILCNGTSMFGECSNGNVVWMQVASGTQCVNGSIQKRSSFVRRHIHRHMRS